MVTVLKALFESALITLFQFSVQGHPNPNFLDQNNLILHHKINELNEKIKALYLSYG